MQTNTPKSTKMQFTLQEKPYSLAHRFRNLSDPLGFIKNESIEGLSSKYQGLRSELKQKQEKASEFSKYIYKKIISQDNKYDFGHSIFGNGQEAVVQFNKRATLSAKEQKIRDKINKEELIRHFKHGQATSLQEKEQLRKEAKQIPLAFKHVKMLQTPQFQKMKEVQFFDLLKKDADESQFSNNLILPNYKADSSHFGAYLNRKFNHSLIADSQFYTKHSYQYLFDCGREFNYWQKNTAMQGDEKGDEDLLSTCAFLNQQRITVFDLFDFATKNIEVKDIVQFSKLKKALMNKVSNQRNSQGVQKRYNQLKRQVDKMKQNRLKAKTQRVPIKYVSMVAQTNDHMQEKDFEQYFKQDAVDIFNKLTKLNQIRDRLIQDEEGQTFRVMATNVGIEISKELFNLILLVLKGEKFNYCELMTTNNQEEVQRRILEFIYMEFTTFQEQDANGISKIDIVKTYLSQRQKNQRFFQSYLHKNQPQKQKPVRGSTNKKTVKKR